MRWVKICPNGHVNGKYDQKCPLCGELLGSIRPTEQDDAAAPPGDALTHPDPTGSEAPGRPDGAATLSSMPPHGAKDSQGVRRTHVANDLLVLQFIRGNRVFNVRDGQIIGSDDGSGDPERANIPRDAGVDVGYVSRWHCRFERQEGCWYVTPLNPRDFGSDLLQANPTYLGSEVLAVGRRYPVENGDRLTLADVELRIVIPGVIP